MCGLGACNQITIAIFSVLFLMTTTFFGGCVFFGHIRLAVILYVIVINIATAIVFAVDKWIARSVNVPNNNTHMFVTDYDVYDMDQTFSDMNLLHSLTVRRSRVYEKVLLFLVFCGGVCGAWLSMLAFWHKVKKTKFVCQMLLMTLVNLLPGLLWLIITSKQYMETICIAKQTFSGGY